MPGHFRWTSQFICHLVLKICFNFSFHSQIAYRISKIFYPPKKKTRTNAVKCGFIRISLPRPVPSSCRPVTSHFPSTSHCPPQNCQKPVSFEPNPALPNLRQVLDCASPLALWNGAARTPAKQITSPNPPIPSRHHSNTPISAKRTPASAAEGAAHVRLDSPPSSILNPLSSVFIQASILP